MLDPLLDLKQQIANGRAVLVVGSGVSIAATRAARAASWVGLLELGVEHCAALNATRRGGWVESTLADIRSPDLADLLSAATKIEQTLKREGEWTRFLLESVGKLEAQEFELLDALGGLGAPILTTNYDGLIEKRLALRSITWRSQAEQIAFHRLENRDAVLHLHGDWHDEASVILGFADYERIVGHQLAQSGLRTLAAAWSLVFIGCGEGLSDPNFEQFLNWMSDVMGSSRHRHFRLECNADEQRRQQWHNERNHHVRVLSYGKTHSDLPSFVAGLRPGAPPDITTTSAPAPPSGIPTPGSSARPKLSAGEYVRLQEKGRKAVRHLVTLAGQLGWESAVARGAELSEVLEQDLYRVAVTGRSRAGKSTLMNALVGRTICPVERVTTTAIPIIIGPGEKESALITYEPNGRPPLPLDGPITVDMLVPYADKRHNPGNEKRVERIDVRLGNQVLDLGVEYVDIPGFDDPSERIWSATNEVIERAHALVVVLDISPHEHGGFALDKSTRELLERARKRECPVLIVCNKADNLSPTLRADAVNYVRSELEQFGLWAALPHPPFFLSATVAAAASVRKEELPQPFAAFEETLWEQLWNTDEVGLRRMYTVFEALRVADEEATVLISDRFTKGPERKLLREALRECEEEKGRIRDVVESGTCDLRNMAEQAVERVRASHLRGIAQHFASLNPADGLPAVSVTIDAFQKRLESACQSVIQELSPSVATHQDRVGRAVSHSLENLRQKAGFHAHTKQSRETMDALSSWCGSVGMPDSGSGQRKLRVAVAGGGSTAMVGLTIGGPLGWLIGLGVGLLVSVVVDHVTDAVDSRAKLQERVERHTRQAFVSFGGAIDSAIVSAGERLDRRIQDRMRPFMNDMRNRLELIREPTPDELRLRDDMHRTTGEAMELLVGLLGLHPKEADEPATSTIEK